MSTRKIIGVIVGLFVTNAYATGENQIMTSKAYVDTNLATKQPILNPNGTDLRNNVVMYTDTAGEVSAKPISNTLTGNNINDQIPTVGGVNTALSDKQGKIAAGNAGDVVTYSGTAGSVGSHAVYNSNASYNANGLLQANHANKAIQNGLNNHLTCVEGNKDPNNSRCWLYDINTQSNNTIYTEHTN